MACNLLDNRFDESSGAGQREPHPTRARPSRVSELSDLEQDLLDGAPRRLSPAGYRARGLAAWAYFTAPAGSEHRGALARDFAAAWVLYRKRLAAAQSLLGALNRAGIDAVVFKGLPMAALAYPHPALRPFGDVDLLVAPEDAGRVAAALGPGWRMHLALPGQAAARHEYATFRAPDDVIEADCHVSVVPGLVAGTRRSARIAQAVRDAARPARIGEVDTRVACPEDMVLIGLAMNRGWSLDAWRLRPTDYLDVHHAIAHWGITEASLAERARALGIERTWRAFRSSCNPFTRRFALARSHAGAAYAWRQHLRLLPELAPPPLLYAAERVPRLPATLVDVARALPALLGTLRDLRVEPQRIAEQVNRGVRQGDGGRPAFRYTRGIGWALRLLAPRVARHPAGLCSIRSVTLYRMMRTDGHPVQWVVGFRPVPGAAPTGHAWVELGGRPVAGFGDEYVAHLYRIAMRIPDEPAAPAARQAPPPPQAAPPPTPA